MTSPKGQLTVTNPFETDLEQTPANYQALTPLSFIERTANTYPNHTAVIYGKIRRSWAETYARCRQLGSALEQHGLNAGETVAAILPNVPAMIEAHFGVSMMGGILNTINVRLDANAIAFILEHGEAKILLTDREFSETVRNAISMLETKPYVIDVDDPAYDGGEFVGNIEYECFIAGGDAEFGWRWPDDEWNACSLNYTSGTTGNPKGVVYHHRGAFLNAIGNLMVWGMEHHPVYLWTLPLFHCNGWCFPWTVAALAGTNICLRRVEAKPIFDAITAHGITHFCGAPIVLNMLANAPESERRPFENTVRAMTAGAAPPPAVIEAMESQGFDVTHVYGLTETYGPSVVSAWHSEWDSKPIAERSTLKARQGVRYHVLEALMVGDPETLAPTPKDGETMGEIFFRGNDVMKGYFKNPKATEEAFAGGWFHSGDLGVWHEDGYIELKDRSKDIIISGGENISSIEVEGILYKHPKILEAAVAARPDQKWGESPCAFVTLKDGESISENEIIDFCRDNMAGFKVPRTVVFGSLPKTSTGKIQKFILRERAKDLGEKTDG
ncbi:MAG: acyl-CoA synthetase [Pseudomonadota bacterium]|nr:acyl-CoA synthetase [Pseudomonadota bacterium]